MCFRRGEDPRKAGSCFRAKALEGAKSSPGRKGEPLRNRIPEKGRGDNLFQGKSLGQQGTRTEGRPSEKTCIYAGNGLYNHCGGNSEEVPPVLMPNTEVKLFYAEDSVSENRTLQIFFCALIVIKNLLVFANTFLHIRPLFFLQYIIYTYLSLILKIISIVFQLKKFDGRCFQY